jgi:UDP-glucose 4-epimerase
VAVTGARTFLGREVLRRLDADPRYHAVLALDVEDPGIAGDTIRFEHVDLTVPTVGAQLLSILRDHRIDTVVHGAYLTFPTHAHAWAHELEDVGTMHVLDACAAARPARLIQLSTTLVYGANPDNPNFISEDRRLVSRGAGFIGDKVRADLQTGRFAEDNRDVATAQLRFAPLLGPTVDGLFTRFFRPPAAPVMMGFDPLMQFVHEHDAVVALKACIDREPPVRGPVNVVGRGVLPYTTVLALMGKLRLPVPHLVARSVARAAWSTQLGKTPPVLLDFLRYQCVADGRRAQQTLGFRAEYDQRQIALDFLGVTGEDGIVDLAQAGVP